MSEIAETVQEVASSRSWDERVQAIRRVPEQHGQQQHKAVYAAIAQELYRPHLSPQVAFIAWRPEYELTPFTAAYDRTTELTGGFQKVAPDDLVALLEEAPEALLILRTIVAFTPSELAIAVGEVARDLDQRPLSASRIKSIEGGSRFRPEEATLCAQTIHRLMTGQLWGEPPPGFRSKLEKPDTAGGWETVRKAAASGVPFPMFLHQRHVGGAFRQLLDATSSRRGDLLEGPVERLLTEAGISFIRTGSANQEEIRQRFNLTVRPAPDFVIFESPGTLKAMIECKQTNDGGTARDKASRYQNLRREAMRLGGIALFAVLDGLGWERLNDALGPVVRDCDGRVFTLKTLPEMLTVQPFSGLVSAE